MSGGGAFLCEHRVEEIGDVGGSGLGRGGSVSGRRPVAHGGGRRDDCENLLRHQRREQFTQDGRIGHALFLGLKNAAQIVLGWRGRVRRGARGRERRGKLRRLKLVRLDAAPALAEQADAAAKECEVGPAFPAGREILGRMDDQGGRARPGFLAMVRQKARAGGFSGRGPRFPLGRNGGKAQRHGMAATGSRIRLGLIGAGGNTRLRHIPGFRAIPGVELAAVANRTRASAEKTAKEFAIARAADDWREIIAAPDIDAVCVGTWPYLHAEIAIAALRAGKHVLTEARMARNLAEAEAMLAEAQRHPSLVAQIVPAPMSLAFDKTIVRLLRDGALGALREVGLTHTGAQFADPAAPLTWRQDYALSGMNTLTLGIHYEMALRWLGREARVVAADAAIFTQERPTENGGRGAVGIPESVTVLGRYGDGARLVAHFSGVEPGAPRNEIRLNGETAGLRLDLAKAELWLAKRGAPEQRVAVPPAADGGWRVEEDFIASIREGRPVRLTDFATGVKYMRFTEAAWRAWAG